MTCEQGANGVRVFVDANQLAATVTASVFTLIGPDAGYTGVCKSVCQNCVLGRCVCVVLNHNAASPFFILCGEWPVWENFTGESKIRIWGFVTQL